MISAADSVGLGEQKYMRLGLLLSIRNAGLIRRGLVLQATCAAPPPIALQRNRCGVELFVLGAITRMSKLEDLPGS